MGGNQFLVVSEFSMHIGTVMNRVLVVVQVVEIYGACSVAQVGG